MDKLTDVTLHISIRPTVISPSLPSTIGKKLEGLDVQLKIPFFRPSLHRQEGDHAKELEREILLLTEWMEDHFPSFYAQSYLQELAQHAVSYMYWSGPFFNVKSSLFRGLVRSLAVGYLADDFVDGNEEAIYEKHEESQKGSFFSTFLSIVKLTERVPLWALAAGARLTLWTSYCCSPLRVAGFCLGILPGFKDLRRSLKDPLLLNAFSAFMSIQRGMMINITDTMEEGLKFGSVNCMILGSRWASKNMRVTSVDIPYSEETYRYFRGVDSGLINFIGMMHLWIHGKKDLPQWVNHTPQMTYFKDVANKIFGGFNDLLGLQKDARKGEASGMIMFRLGRADSEKSAVQVIEEEVGLLKQYINDYALIRQEVLDTFPKAASYVGMVDAALFGGILSFLHSTRFGMSGKIRIQITDDEMHK